jgi:hypothetical protein
MPAHAPQPTFDAAETGDLLGWESRQWCSVNRTRSVLIGPTFDLNPLERARTELKLAPGFLVRSAPKPRRVVDRVGA